MGKNFYFANFLRLSVRKAGEKEINLRSADLISGARAVCTGPDLRNADSELRL
jgi:hypothetical protein